MGKYKEKQDKNSLLNIEPSIKSFVFKQKVEQNESTVVDKTNIGSENQQFFKTAQRGSYLIYFKSSQFSWIFDKNNQFCQQIFSQNNQKESSFLDNLDVTSKKESFFIKNDEMKAEDDSEGDLKKDDYISSYEVGIKKKQNNSLLETPNRKQFRNDRQVTLSQEQGKVIVKKELKLLMKICRLFFQIRPKILWFSYRFTLQGRQKNLTPEIRQKINDISDSYFIKRKLGMYQIFMKKINKCFENATGFIGLHQIPIFDPENKFRILFNALILAYNIFYLFILNFHIVFNANFGTYQNNFHIIALFSWTIEMLMDINTAIYYGNEFITDRRRIAQIILKKNFFFEIIPLIFESISTTDRTINIILTLPILLKIRGMIIITIKLEFFILQQFKQRYLLELFKLVFKLFLLTHVMACSYFLFVQMEKQIFHVEGTWLDKSSIIDGGWLAAYTEAQVWAFSTMCSTASSSIKTSKEYLFTSFWMLISCIAMAYLINKIGVILKELNEQSEIYRRDLNLLNQFMNRKHINLGLQRRLNLDLKQQFEQESLKQQIDVKHTLCRLSEYSYRELMKESYKNTLKDLPYFKNCISQESLIKIYQIMEELAFSTNQVIDEEDNIYGSSLYIVLSGKVSLRSKINEDSDHHKKNNTEQVIQVINPGGSFGLHEFLTGYQKVYYAQSEDLSVIVKVDMNKFIEIIRANEADYQKYLEFRERLIYSIDQEQLQLKCLICNQKDHHISECHFIHLNKKNPFLFYRSCRSEVQQRGIYNRLNKKINRIYYHVEENDYYSQFVINNSDNYNHFTCFENHETFPELNHKFSTSNLNYEKSVISVNNLKDQQQNHQIQKFKKQISIDNQIDEDENEQEDHTTILQNRVYKSSTLFNKMKSNLLQDQNSCNVIESSIFNNDVKEPKEKSCEIFKKSAIDFENSDGQIKEQRIRLKVQFKPVSFQKINLPSSYLKITKKKSEEEEKSSIPSIQQNSIQEAQILFPSEMNAKNEKQQIRRKTFYELDHIQKTQQQIQAAIMNNSNHPNQLHLQKNDNHHNFVSTQNISTTKQAQEWRDSSEYWNFDQMKIMKYYFVSGNYDNIMKKLILYNVRKDRRRIDLNNKTGISITKANMSNKHSIYITMMNTLKTMKSMKLKQKSTIVFQNN